MRALARRITGDGPFAVRVAVAGFLLAPAGAAAVGLTTLALGLRTPSGVVIRVAAAAVLNLVGAALLRRSQRYLVACTLLASGLVVLAFPLGAGFGLRHPDSVVDFTTALVMVAGPSTAAVWGLVALRDTALPAGLERRAVVAGVAVLALAVSVSGGLTAAQGARTDAPPGATVVQVRNNRFEPVEIVAAAGTRLHVYVVNRDAYAHTFSIPGLGVNAYIAPRSERLVGFELPDPGSFPIVCYVTGHGAMRGVLQSPLSMSARKTALLDLG